MNVTTTTNCPETGADESDDSGPSSSSSSDPDPDQRNASDDQDQPPEPTERATGSSRSAIGPSIDWLDRSGRADALDERWIRARLQEACACLDRTVDRIGVLLVDDERMTTLHAEHRGEAATTDVLSFCLSEPEQPVDADIVVCVDEAARRVRGTSVALERELLLYCVHGLLHCVGYDDATPEAFAVMHAREDEILDAIGVGVTFGGPTAHDAGARES
ncbi:MAG: rRNA maturation RNase YbeY [Planctomycetota bacterium]|jgi:probable rRNA maturation factor